MKGLEVGEKILIRNYWNKAFSIATGWAKVKIAVNAPNILGNIVPTHVEKYKSLKDVKDLDEFTKHLELFNSLVKEYSNGKKSK